MTNFAVGENVRVHEERINKLRAVDVYGRTCINL